MTLREILEYKLIELDNYSLTLYNILAFIVVLVVARVLLYLLRKLMMRAKGRIPVDVGRAQTVYQILKYFIWVVAIVVALQAAGINVTILLAGSAALFVGLGFGLQALFNDLASGVILLFEGTIQIGDIIEVDGLVAEVKKINFRTSTVVSRDDIVMIIPNHKFVSENVINWSHHQGQTRFRVAIGVSYGSDVELVRKVLEGTMKSHADISQTPHAPFVRFTNFGESSLNFELLFWSNNRFRIENTMSDLRFAIVKSFNENGITIPFPQVDLHLKSDATGRFDSASTTSSQT